MLDFLGHPERAVPKTLSIVGTNGKGSVAATLSAAATAAGWRVGMFTSPHLVRPHERFRVDDIDIDAEGFDRVGGQVLDAIDASGIPLSFFEAIATLAILRFAEAKVDLQILEAGLGGVRDATSAVRATHVTVTGIAKDHTRTLGPTLGHIAREKLGVCRPDTRNVLVVPPALRDRTLDGWLLGRDYRFRGLRGGTIRVWHPGGVLDLPNPALRGPHQRRNMAVAAATALRLGIPEEAIRAGVQNARWAARMQPLPGPVPTWLDGAHNPDGIRALFRTLAELGVQDGFTLVFGAHDRVHTPRNIQKLAEHAGAIFLTTADRIAEPERLAEMLPGRADVHLEPEAGLAVARAQALGRPVVVAGSLYMAGAVLRYLETHNLG